jgi:hypothetical protein
MHVGKTRLASKLEGIRKERRAEATFLKSFFMCGDAVRE